MELELNLKTPLVQRSTRRLSVTEAGARLFAHAESHVAELEAAARSVSSCGPEVCGTLRVTTPNDTPGFSFVAIVHSFLVKYPQVNLVLITTNRRVDLVAEGVDVALRGGPLPSSALVARRLAVSEFQLFASDDYLERRGTPQSVDDLSKHDCLVFSEDVPKKKWQLRSSRLPSKSQDVLVSGRCAISDLGALARACAAGMGIALLPTELVAGESLSHLRRVLPDWRGPDSVIHAVYPPSKQVSPLLKAFIDHLAAEFARPFARARS
jgi:LysR family transcriptional regulator AphB